MRLLLVHNEDEFFGGAETLLVHYVNGLVAQGIEVALAIVAGSRLDQRFSSSLKRAYIGSGRSFSLRKLRLQARRLSDYRQDFPYDLIHGWAARTWELVGLVRRQTGCPALLTLHDHPRASYISFLRSRLMWASARFGADYVACVSDAVRRACLQYHYPSAKLAVVHNGFPAEWLTPKEPREDNRLRIGFIGQWSAAKGLDGLLHILDKVAEILGTDQWECRVAGSPLPDDNGWLHKTCSRFKGRPWWPQIEWTGWVDDSQAFLRSLDLLLFPSREFDSFPNVLLEAGFAGVPVLASSVGGAPEIVQESETGWLFPPEDWAYAASRLSEAIQSPATILSMGNAAQARMSHAFTTKHMTTSYLDLYRRISQQRVARLVE